MRAAIPIVRTAAADKAGDVCTQITNAMETSGQPWNDRYGLEKAIPRGRYGWEA